LKRFGLIAAALAMALAACSPAKQAAAPSSGLTPIKFATDWRAQAEQGGFYEALATGEYKKRGLDVTIIQGGPAVDVPQLLATGAIDMGVGSNSFIVLNIAKAGAPIKAVMATMQEDPQVLIAHPDQGIEKFEDLKKLTTLFISKEGMATYYQWLRTDYGFKETQVKPYTFNAQPFLADKKSAMQGYVTSEPYAVEKAGKFKPKIFLLADQGFNTYSTLIETRRDLVEKKPDMVQRFVDASIIGWYNYIYGDNKPANAMIKKQNPEMTDELLAYSVTKMKEFGIVDSGDALTLGVGAMTDARMKDFFDKMARVGVTKATIDYRKAYTLQFVDKKVGLDLRPK
jgi:NitT/TauT family transport system substrate-binding protein